MMGPLPYVGGKRRLAPLLLSLIPPHITYVEAFAGGAQLFFHKPRSEVEILNDLDSEVVNFHRVCQRHPQEVVRLLRHQPASRQLFSELDRLDPTTLTDCERAARFLYLQKNSWGGRRARHNFHYSVTKPSNYRPAFLKERIQLASERLAEAQIENLPYQDIIARYDRPSTFFYLDPPYVGVDLYAHNFTDEQFADMAKRLGGLQGRFLMSINDCEKARAWFAPFHCREVEFTYTAIKKPKVFRELLFSNYPFPSLALTPTH